MNFKFGKISLKRLETTEPIVQQIAHEVLSRSPYDFGIPEYGGRRTEEEEQHLVDIGKSKTMHSYHRTGMALDICRYMGNGKYSFKKEDIQPIADLFKQVGEEKGVNVIWGGDWEIFIDAPHFQIQEIK